MSNTIHQIRRIYETQVEHNFREITLAAGLFEDLLREAERADRLQRTIDLMQQEINHSFDINKSEEMRRFYLDNAIRLGDRRSQGG